jgi:hypothetical protein
MTDTYNYEIGVKIANTGVRYQSTPGTLTVDAQELQNEDGECILKSTGLVEDRESVANCHKIVALWNRVPELLQRCLAYHSGLSSHSALYKEVEELLKDIGYPEPPVCPQCNMEMAFDDDDGPNRVPTRQWFCNSKVCRSSGSGL